VKIVVAIIDDPLSTDVAMSAIHTIKISTDT